MRVYTLMNISARVFGVNFARMWPRFCTVCSTFHREISPSYMYQSLRHVGSVYCGLRSMERGVCARRAELLALQLSLKRHVSIFSGFLRQNCLRIFTITLNNWNGTIDLPQPWRHFLPGVNLAVKPSRAELESFWP